MSKILDLQNIQFPKLKATYLAALIPTAVAINFAGFGIRQGLGIPLFLDSGGTLLVTFMAGPWYGALCAVLQAVIRALTVNPMMVFAFAPTFVTALIVGYCAKKGITRTWFGLVLIFILMTPITCAISSFTFTYIYGGFTGSTMDIVKSVFVKSTGKIFAGAYVSELITNIFDKAVLIALVMAILHALPEKYRAMTPLHVDKE